MAVHEDLLLALLAMNPLMTFDHTNPFSTLNTTAPLELREHRVIQIPPDYTRLEAQLMTPMKAIAHERQFVTAQLGRSNHEFETKHTMAVEHFLKEQDRVLRSLSDAIVERDQLLRFSMPQGTEDLPATTNLQLVIDDLPRPSPLQTPSTSPRCPTASVTAAPSAFSWPTNPSLPSKSAMSISFINNPTMHSNDFENISVDSRSSSSDIMAAEMPQLEELRKRREGPLGSRVSRPKRFRERNPEILQQRQPSKYALVEKKITGRTHKLASWNKKKEESRETPDFVPEMANGSGKRRLSDQVDDAIQLEVESEAGRIEELRRRVSEEGRLVKRVKFEGLDVREPWGFPHVDGSDEDPDEEKLEAGEKADLSRRGWEDSRQREVQMQVKREPDG